MPEPQVVPVTAATAPSAEALLALYEAVGWTSYTASPAAIRSALDGSSFAAVARVQERLVGLVRVVSDDVTVAFVQDVLVHPDVQRTGVGAALMASVLTRFAHVRRVVLLTDDEPRQRAFYESLGFTEARDVGDGSLRTFVR